MSMFGDPIVASRTAGGHRDYLLNEPIYAGASLDLWGADTWVHGRYEGDLSIGEAYFVYRGPDDMERWVRINRETMRFRWPTW